MTILLKLIVTWLAFLGGHEKVTSSSTSVPTFETVDKVKEIGFGLSLEKEIELNDVFLASHRILISLV